MTTEDMITAIFCLVDDQLREVPKHPQAELFPSEIITIGRLFALKGGYFRPFYRWRQRDYQALFPKLPDRTRVQRLLKTHQGWLDRFLAAPSFFTVIDSYPIALIFPIRQGRSDQQVGKKGKDTGRWSVGITWCWLLNNYGMVVDWDGNTLHVHDQHVHPVMERHLGETIVLSDRGFRCQEGIPDNCQWCPKGTWNERMRVETSFSMVTVVCDLKRIRHRLAAYIQTRLALVVALFNVLLTLFHHVHPDADPLQMSIAEFSL
jgi:hypothetical protein